MTQPNEQLIEIANKLANAKYWPMEDVEKVPDILRALLEENKLLRESKLNVEHNRQLLSDELQQTREELEQVKFEREHWHKYYMQERELGSGQKDRLRKELESIHTELAAKDKVLQWYADEENHENVDAWGERINSNVREDAGDRAREVLSSYPPREKGATANGSDF